MPPGTELLCGVSYEATDVGSNHRDPKLVELQDPDDGVLEVGPVGEVVPKPVTCKLSLPLS